MIKKLEKLGAKRTGVFKYKRYVYDLKPVQKGKWIITQNKWKINNTYL